MVDAGRKHLEHIIQMNLLQQQHLIDRPFSKPLLNFQPTTNNETSTITDMPVTTSSPSLAKHSTESTLEQLQMQYQHIMTQMQLGLSSHTSAITNYALPEQVCYKPLCKNTIYNTTN